jgi:hypothetical protein
MRRARSFAACLGGVLAGSAWLGACDGGVGAVNPAPVRAVPSPTATLDAGVPEGGADAAAPPVDARADSLSLPDSPPPVDAGPKRRDVLVRSPFGNLAPLGNLFIDGDFEWSAPGGQTPWLALDVDQGQVDLALETGGACRSGLRCARMNNVTDLLGEGIAATHAGLEISFWAKVPGASCSVVTATLISLQTFSTWPVDEVLSETDAPDASGWCRFHGVKSKWTEAPGVYISTQGLKDGETIIVDDAVMVAADGLSPLGLGSGPISADLARRIAFAGDWLRKHRVFGREGRRQGARAARAK